MGKKEKRGAGAYTLVDDVVISAKNGVVCVDVVIGDETLRFAAGFALAVRVVRRTAKVLDRENVVTFEKAQAG